MPLKKNPVSKTRNMDVSPVQGAATRSYETAPSKTIDRFGSDKAGEGQKARGTGGLIKRKMGKIPNKF